jgi:hypothetical protein
VDELTPAVRVKGLARCAGELRNLAVALEVLGAPGEAKQADSLAQAVDVVREVIEHPRRRPL